MKHKHNQRYVINPQFVFLLSDVNNMCFNCLVRRYWASHSAYLWQRDVCHHVMWSTSLWRLGWFWRRWIEIVWRSRHVERNLYRRPDVCYMSKIYEKIMFRYCTSRRTVFEERQCTTGLIRSYSRSDNLCYRDHCLKGMDIDTLSLRIFRWSRSEAFDIVVIVCSHSWDWSKCLCVENERPMSLMMMS